MENEGDARTESNPKGAGRSNLPKHIPFPDVPETSDLINELILFLFILFSAGMQFLHIYRTVWWLPESYINHTINLYLIDAFLVTFITTILARRFLCCLLDKIVRSIYGEKFLKAAKYIYANALGLILATCTVKIFLKHSYLSLFLLLYPFVVYVVIFGFQIDAFIGFNNDSKFMYMNGMPWHCCSSHPDTVRQEILVLKDDFNSRFKQVIFTSVINAYYSGFVPCFFAQNFLYYDVLWVTQHIIFVWLGGFTMCTVFNFPAKYCDVLHRSALHLGRWCRIDGRSSATQPPYVWNPATVWNPGSIIRYSGKLYKSIGPVTMATPGNMSHVRFHKLFNNPSVLYMVLVVLQIFLVVLQILLLCFAIEWHNILSLSFLTLTNHHTLFKIVRDFLVTQKVYAAESSIHEKMGTHFN